MHNVTLSCCAASTVYKMTHLVCLVTMVLGAAMNSFAAPTANLSLFSVPTVTPAQRGVHAGLSNAVPSMHLGIHHPHENDLKHINQSAITRALMTTASLTLNTTDAVLDGDFVKVEVINPTHAHGTPYPPGTLTHLFFSYLPPIAGDWIGMYTMSADPTTTKPLKYTYCLPAMDPSYSIDGTGDVTFQVYLVREPVIFYLFAGGISKPVLLTKSAPLSFIDYNAHIRPRVMPGSSAGSFVIAWSTAIPVSIDVEPVLLWWTHPSLTTEVRATFTTIPHNSLCGAPATTTGWMDLGATASATVQLPSPGATVYYVLTDTSHLRPSKQFAFRVPPAAGPSYPMTFLCLADLGRGSWDNGVTWNEYGRDSRSTALRLAADVQSLGASFIHHFGDISYAVGYLQVWDEFTWMSSQYAATAVYAIGVGNHESDWPASSSW